MDLHIERKHNLYIYILGAILFMQQSWVPGFFQDGYFYAEMGKNAATLGHWLVPHLSKNNSKLKGIKLRVCQGQAAKG